MRAISVAFSPARPSRLKNEPGILPAAYMRSSTSTVSGRKSTSRRLPAVAVESTIVSPGADDDGAGGLLGHLARLERDLRSADLDGDRVRRQTYVFPSAPALRSAGRLCSLICFRTR